MFEQQCPAKSVTTQKPKQMKSKCADSRCCSALNIPVVWQWRWWWWWAKSNWLSLSLSFSTPPKKTLVFNPHDSQGPRQPNKLFRHLPSSQPERQPRGSCGRIIRAGKKKNKQKTNQQTGGFLQQCPSNPLERSVWSVSFVCLSVWSTTLPRLHSQRLQWEITFLVNLIFFLSGLTFH